MKATRKSNPKIIHSDRGSQFTSKEYCEITAGITRSYSKKAYPWDNACIESFHAIIKREWGDCRFCRIGLTGKDAESVKFRPDSFPWIV